MTNFNLQSLAQLDRSRFAGYKANLDFYNGEQWAEKSDPSRRSGRQLVFNYAKIAIDKVTSYLMEGLNFACEPSENQTLNIKNQKLNSKDQRDTARKAEKVIYDVYHQNNLQELDYETEVDTAILGDGCFKVTWDAQEKRIRVTSPDVTGLFAWWLGDDLSQVWRVASRYTLTREEVEQLYPSLRSRTGQRQTDKKTVTITELWTDRQFTLSLDNETIEDKPVAIGIPTVLKYVWHVILDGNYVTETPEINRAFVIGRDAYGNPVWGEAHDSAESSLVGERLDFIPDPAIPTTAQAGDVASAVLSKMRLHGKGGVILIPPNCGQELFDVVELTDIMANQSAVKFRVVGLRFEYSPKQARYQHKLILGAP